MVHGNSEMGLSFPVKPALQGYGLDVAESGEAGSPGEMETMAQMSGDDPPASLLPHEDA